MVEKVLQTDRGDVRGRSTPCFVQVKRKCWKGGTQSTLENALSRGSTAPNGLPIPLQRGDGKPREQDKGQLDHTYPQLKACVIRPGEDLEITAFPFLHQAVRNCPEKVTRSPEAVTGKTSNTIAL